MKQISWFLLFLAITIMQLGCFFNKKEIEKNTNINNVQIIKAKNDGKLYKYVVLENGLNVVIISDPTAEKSAASMNVLAGTYHAPKEWLGLPHFLEHMLFINNDKYPEPDGFFTFLSANGGSSNAYTASKNTNYYFSVNNEAITEAFSRFSQFFISPKLSEEFVEKERHAVHSEYVANINDEYRRLLDVEQETANPNSPYSKFSVGNLNTLHNDNGDSLLKALKKFYKEHYVASNMNLVVYGKESIEDLTLLVQKLFHEIPGRNIVKPKKKIKQPPFLPRQLGVKINIKTLKDVHRLVLEFPIPDINQYLESKSLDYLSHIIGYEGPGSILHLLRNKGLAYSLRAGGYDIDNCGLFKIGIELTEKGYQEYNEVTALVFDYVDLIKKDGISQYLYSDLKKISELRFDYEEENPLQLVMRLSQVLDKVSIQNLLRYQSIYKGLNIDEIKEILDKFSPKNLRQILLSNDIKTDKKTNFYDVSYSIQHLNKILIKRLNKPQINESMYINKKNPFIVEDVELKKGQKNSEPIQMIDEKGLTVWMMTDTSFNVPKGNIYLRVSSKNADQTIKQAVLLDLFLMLVNDELLSFGYPALVAGLNYKLSVDYGGFFIVLSGYQDKQPLILSEIINRIRKFTVRIDDFNQEKERLYLAHKNYKFLSAWEQAKNYLNNFLFGLPYDNKKYIDTIKSLSLEDLYNYVKNFKSSMHISMFVSGNFSEKETLKLTNIVSNKLLTKSNRSAEYEPKILALKGHTIEKKYDFGHPDTVYKEYAQFYVKDLKLVAMYKLLNSMMPQYFFKELRTMQQLGYLVHMELDDFQDYIFVNYYIQSPNSSTVQIKKSIDQFLLTQVERFRNLKASELEKYKRGLTLNLLKKPKNTWEKSSQFWYQILEKRNFNYINSLVSELQSLTVEDMQSALQRLIENKGRVIISSEGDKKLI